MAKATTKHGVEKIGEVLVREIPFGIEGLPAPVAPLPLLLPLVLLLCFLVLFPVLPILAILIVLGSFIRITQYLVRLVELLEFLLRLLVVRVQVGMQLTGQLAIRLFYVFCRRVLVDSQYLVIINVCHFLADA